VIANAIVSVYGLLVLFLPPKSLLWRFVVALDVVIFYKFSLNFLYIIPVFLFVDLIYIYIPSIVLQR
jgi:hypothetical protein